MPSRRATFSEAGFRRFKFRDGSEVIRGSRQCFLLSLRQSPLQTGQIAEQNVRAIVDRQAGTLPDDKVTVATIACVRRREEN